MLSAAALVLPGLLHAAAPLAGADTAPVPTRAARSDSADTATARRLTFGGGVGGFSYADGYTERLAMVGARVRLAPGVTLAAHPGFATASGLASTTTTRRRRRRTSTSRTASGLTDLPAGAVTAAGAG